MSAPTFGADDLLLSALGLRAAQGGMGRRLRLALGLGLREVARDLGVEASLLGRWERGMTRPSGRHAPLYGALVLRLLEAQGAIAIGQGRP